MGKKKRQSHSFQPLDTLTQTNRTINNHTTNNITNYYNNHNTTTTNSANPSLSSDSNNYLEPIINSSPLKRLKHSGSLLSSPLQNNTTHNTTNTTTTTTITAHNNNNSFHSIEEYKLKMLGSIIFIKIGGGKFELFNLVASIIINKNNIYLNLTKSHNPILNKRIDLLNDCKEIIFDKDLNSIGFYLNKSKQIISSTSSSNNNNSSSSSSGNEKIFRTFLLKLNDSNNHKALKIMIRKINQRALNVRIYQMDYENLIMERLDNLNKLFINNNSNTNSLTTNFIDHDKIANDSFQAIFKKQNTTFLQKKNFGSLNMLNKPKNHNRNNNNNLIKSNNNLLKNVTRIRLPSNSLDTDSSNNNNNSKNNKNKNNNHTSISVNDFYDNNNNNHKPINNNLLLQKRRSIRNLLRDEKKDLLIDDDDDDDLNLDKNYPSNIVKIDSNELTDFEIPKEFKPTLREKFNDGMIYTVTNQDFKCLYNNDWINDSIIDFLIKFFVEKSISSNIIKRDDVYIMSSFFYTKLITNYHNNNNITNNTNNNQLLESNNKSIYDNVKKWVSNANLMNKKYIVIPLNINYHWFGCIIINLDIFLQFELNKRKNLQESTSNKQISNDDTTNSDTNTTNNTTSNNNNNNLDISIGYPIIQILTFDSLRGTHTREVDPIKDFIILYAMDKYNLKIDKSCIKMKTCLVPEQPNMSDCGVHVILTIKKFFEDPIKTLDIWRSTKLRNKESIKLINNFFEMDKRNQARFFFREILLNLQKVQIEKFGNQSQESSDHDDENDYDDDFEIIEDNTNYDKLENNNTERQENRFENDNIVDDPNPENDSNNDSEKQSSDSDNHSSNSPSPKIIDQPSSPIKKNFLSKPINENVIDPISSPIHQDQDDQNIIDHRENDGSDSSIPNSDQNLNTSPYFERAKLRREKDKSNIEENLSNFYSNKKKNFDSSINTSKNLIIPSLELDSDVNLVGVNDVQIINGYDSDSNKSDSIKSESTTRKKFNSSDIENSVHLEDNATIISKQVAKELNNDDISDIYQNSSHNNIENVIDKPSIFKAIDIIGNNVNLNSHDTQPTTISIDDE